MQKEEQRTIEEATLKHIHFLVSKVKVLCIVYCLSSGYVIYYAEKRHRPE